MRRGPSSLLVATVVHAAVLLAITVVPSRRRHVERSAEPKTVEIDLDLRENPQAPSSAANPAEPEEPQEKAPRRYVAPMSAKVMARGAAQPKESEEPTALPQEPPPLAVEDQPSELPSGFRASPNPITLVGLGGGMNPFLSAVPPEREHEEKGAERAVRSVLRERDRKIGLGVSGPVVAAVEAVARTSTASVESHAVLEVVADGEGRVVSVSVSDASEDRPGWDGVAKGLLAAMRSKRLHVPKGSRGVVMTIAIDSREALPSGAAPGVNVSVFDQKVHSGKNERSAAVHILPLAKLPIALPAPGKPGGVEVKTLVLPIPVPQIDAVFDAADFGAAAARVIHAHATSEREL